MKELNLSGKWPRLEMTLGASNCPAQEDLSQAPQVPYRGQGCSVTQGMRGKSQESHERSFSPGAGETLSVTRKERCVWVRCFLSMCISGSDVGKVLKGRGRMDGGRMVHEGEQAHGDPRGRRCLVLAHSRCF